MRIVGTALHIEWLLLAGISFDKARAVFGAFTKNGRVPG